MAKPSISERGVYAIECVDGRAYIGCSVSVRRRWQNHRHHLRRGTHRNRQLQSIWSEKGEAAFTFRVLEQVPLADLRQAEQSWLNHSEWSARLLNVYHAPRPATISAFSDECRARMAAAQHGIHDGHKNPNAKLTLDDVLEIRRLAETGTPYPEIGKMFGISRENVGMIVRRQRWSHIT